jgi:hypothetical protein
MMGQVNPLRRAICRAKTMNKQANISYFTPGFSAFSPRAARHAAFWTGLIG